MILRRVALPATLTAAGAAGAHRQPRHARPSAAAGAALCLLATPLNCNASRAQPLAAASPLQRSALPPRVRQRGGVPTTMEASASRGAEEATEAGPSLQAAEQPQQAQQDVLVQYVVVRKDLWAALKWPLGSVVAQACHASAAAIWMWRDDQATKQYLAEENLDQMRKVVLEAKDEAALLKLAAALLAAGVKHKLWVEQPEDTPTCLATRPYAKAEVAQHFKKFQLAKTPIGSA